MKAWQILLAVWLIPTGGLGAYVVYLAILDRIDQWRLRRRVDISVLRGWDR